MPKNNTSSLIPPRLSQHLPFSQAVSFALVALVVGALGGFLSTQVFFKPAPSPGAVSIPEEGGEKVVKEEELPLSPDILLSPLIHEWQASLTGTLIEKTDTSFTLERDGVPMTILVKENYTLFLAEGSRESELLSELPLGTFLGGTIWLGTKWAHPLTDTPGDIVGGFFQFEL